MSRTARQTVASCAHAESATRRSSQASTRLRARLKPVALALACMGPAPAMAQLAALTLPTGASLVSGSAAVGSASLVNGVYTLGISQTTGRAVLNWNSFSIGSGAQVSVSQINAASVLLNRVTGAQASVIAGKLNSSLAGNPAAIGGSIYLINPNGVTFAGTAQVNVGGLLASTLDIEGSDQTTRNARFMAAGTVDAGSATATLSFAKTAGNTNGVTVQQGASINATHASGGTSGAVTLLGSSVSNAGTISAPGGAVNLASADKLTLVIDPVGDGLTTLRINNPSALNALVENIGTVSADGGTVALRASSSAAETVVRHSGVLSARTLETRGGQIVLDGGSAGGNTANLVSIEGGQIAATGRLADGTGSGAGGTVAVNSQQVRFSAGTVNASGTSGGGVTLYGDNALAMAPAAAVTANGVTGAGGTIQVGAGNILGGAADATSSGGAAHISGSLKARGATDGGTIGTTAAVLEVSRTAVIDATGGTGANGTWTVNSARTVNITNQSGYGDPVYDASAFPAATNSSYLADAAVGSALGRATNVTVNSGGIGGRDYPYPDGIYFNSGVQVVKSQGRASTLTLNSDRSIDSDQAFTIQATSAAGPLNLDFNADAHGQVVNGTAPMTSESNGRARLGYITLEGATLQTQGGGIRMYGQSDPTAGRAVGGLGSTDNNYQATQQGVTLNNSLLDTCAGTDCTGSGAIVLRGQGGTTVGSGGAVSSGAGIVLGSSTLSTSAGGIALDGVGGLGSSGIVTGVAASRGDSEGFNLASVAVTDANSTTLQSVSGAIGLTGKSRDWVAGDPTGLFPSSGNAGLAVSATSVVTGGNVTLTGAGGDVSAALGNTGFVAHAPVGTSGSTVYFGSSNGISLQGSSITAGTGKTITLNGTAGSDAFNLSRNPSTGLATAAPDSPKAFAVLVNAATTNGLQAAGGNIVIAGGKGDVALTQVVNQGDGGGFNAVGDTTRVLASTTSSTGKGGSIAITGRNILVQGDSNNVAQLNSSGATGGGLVSVVATAVADIANSGIVAIDASTLLSANATGNTGGNAGTVTLNGATSLIAYGGVQATSVAGAGGTVSTSGASFDLTGIRIATAGATGKGSWVIDPYDIDIVHGTAAGSLTGSPFTAVAASTLQDGDINQVLGQGTSVSIGTGSGGDPTTGDIRFGSGVNLTAGSGGVAGQTLEFDAYRSIRSLASNVVIGTQGGTPLNVVFKADANNNGPAVGGGQVSYDGNIYTNGGNVTMSGNWSATGAGDTALHLTGIVDTRVTGTSSGLGGNVTLTGATTTPVANSASNQSGVWLNGSTISTASGNVVVSGSSTNNTGVRIDGFNNLRGIFTTSGNITVTGVGTEVPVAGTNSLPQSSAGVLVNIAGVGSTTGAIALRGSVTDTNRANNGSAGVLLSSGATLTTTGTIGDIELSGSAAANGRGVWVQPTPTGTTAFPQARVSSGHNLLLRASNNGSSDAIMIGAPVSAATAIDLRPGAVNASGNATDLVVASITVGTGAATGFAVSDTDFAQMTAPSIVVGGNLQSGAITVGGALSTGAALTLENDAGGGIRLNGTVTAPTLGLVSGGDITQAAAGSIAATNLMVVSSGSVNLQNSTNNAANFGFSAVGGVSYVDADALTLAPVSVPVFSTTTGLGATSRTVQNAGSASIFTRTQDLTISSGLTLNGALALQASSGSIRSTSSGVVIQTSVTGIQPTTFNAAGQIDYAGALYTNGGGVNMNGNWFSGGATDSAIRLAGIVDTRVGRSDAAGGGGSVTLNGTSSTAAPDGSSGAAGVLLDSAAISTAGGNIAIAGTNSNNTGVRIHGVSSTQGLFTTSGNITVNGLGTDRPAVGTASALLTSSGVLVDGAAVRAGSGAVVLRGNVTDTAKAGSTSAGVSLSNGARVSTTGSGNIEFTGSAATNGRGLWVQGGTGSSSVAGSGNVVLRASNNGTADAITIAAPVSATGTIDLRPGSESAGAVASDNPATAITLGAGAVTGFAVSDTDLAQLAAPTIVAGSNTQSGNITVVGALATTASLTLQNSAGGSIQVNGPVQAANLGLISAGDITQGTNGTLSAGNLLARSTGGSVTLENTGNHMGTVGGSASGAFNNVDADALTIGAVSATGFDATAGAPTTQTATTLDAASAHFRTASQDLAISTGMNLGTALLLEANGAIRSANPGVVIQAATSAPLSVTFQASQINYGGAVYSNGGDVAMSGGWLLGGATDSALRLSGIVDTRVGRSDAAASGGNVSLNGVSNAVLSNPGSTQAGLWLNGATISTASGNITAYGSNNYNTGVRIDGASATRGLFTTTGAIAIGGLGTDRPASGTGGTVQSSSGLVVDGATVRSASGAISLHGKISDSAKTGSISTGVLLTNGANVATTGGGAIDLTGSAIANGRGIWVQTGAGVSGGSDVLLRAGNDGTTDAITLAAPVITARTIDLRPGTVSDLGSASDSTATAITLGAGAATGFAVSDADFSQLSAVSIVAGSSTHAGNITVAGALTTPASVTLQNSAGGIIQLNGAVDAAKLGLISAGDITQTASAGAGVTAGTLLARSTGGKVDLQNASNHVSTVGGSAAGAFSYVDAGSVTLAAVSATGFDASTNQPTTQTATSLNAGPVLLRSVAQDLTVATGITAGASVELDGGRSVLVTDPNVVIQARTSAPLEVTVKGGQIDYRGSVFTNGGTVAMTGNGVHLGGIVDTRVGRSDAAGSGGAVTVAGTNTNGVGVQIDGNSAAQGVFTASGNIAITGVGADIAGTTSPLYSSAVLINGATIRSTTGTIAVRGSVTDITKAGSTSSGVTLGSGTTVATTGGGAIELTGSANANGRGLSLQAGSGVSGSSNVVLRANNDGTADAITLDAPVVATNTIDLRPGAVTSTGIASDSTATAITLGTGAATGFAVSDTEFAHLSATNIVAGSNAHAGNITVAGALTTPASLTLQNGAGGSIQLNGAVNAAKLGLISAGGITQTSTAGAGITAGTLLARSTGGKVDLQNASNHVSTLSGGASGGFSYVDAGSVSLAAVSATGFDATANRPTTETSSTLTAGSVLLRSVAEDITVATGITAGSNVELDGGRSVLVTDPNVLIQAGTVGPMAMTVNGGHIDYRGSVFTNGGNVAMTGTDMRLGGIVDTRVGSSDAAGTGGAVTLAGTNSSGVGVQIDGSSAAQGVFTASGNIAITGIGTDMSTSGTPLSSSGVLINGASIRSTTGTIALRGSVADIAKAGSTSSGVTLGRGATVATTSGGAIELTGSANANGRGLSLQAGSGVSGSSNVVLRANNDGTADAITLAAPVVATNTIDLRPGSVSRTGVASDSTGTVITLGTGAATGFAVSDADFARLGATNIVAGSNSHAGDITVAGALTTPASLTLQNGAGGNIQLTGPITANTLGLISAGNIGQTAAGALAANTLLSRSTGGNVDLQSPSNRVAAVGGSAAGSFSYGNADALSIAAVSAPGFDASVNRPTTEAASGIATGSATVRTLTQDLTLAAPVIATGDVDLIAGATFQNTGSQAISARNWRVWADTWIGEARGGLSGNGSLPNVYDCAYLGLCSVSVPNSSNHFVYTRQPTVTVVVGDATRDFGGANPTPTYSVTGLILGDSAGSVSGTPSSAANAASPAGTYAIGGSFVSAAGYAITVTPGRLTVNAQPMQPVQPTQPGQPTQTIVPATYLASLPVADAMADTSNIYTYTFDRNIAPPPICAATGPLDGDRASQGNDVLAREWSRVRARPNLSSCVATDRRNGCGDF